MTNEKKFNELLENKDFMQEIISMETLEEVQGGFAKQGVEVSKDEVEQLGEVIEEVNEKISKLSDDELNLIVGGSSADYCTSSSDEALGDHKGKVPGKWSKKAIIGITVGVAGTAVLGTGIGIHAWWKKKHH